MNRTKTVAKAVARLVARTGRKEEEVEAIARELIDAEELPKSKGRDFAQLNVREFGLLTLATLCVDRPTRAVTTLAEYTKLRLIAPEKAKSEDLHNASSGLALRGLLLSAEPLPNISTLLALFQVDYFQRPNTEFYDRVSKATILLDRAHPSAIIDWGGGLGSVFGRLKPTTDGAMPVETRWQLKSFLLAQLNFFTTESGWVGEEKQA